MSTVVARRTHEQPLRTAQEAGGLHIVRELNANAWRQFVDAHPQGNIFHTPEMFDVFRSTRGFEPTQWAVTFADGSIAALIQPVLVTLSKLLNTLTTRAVSYGSVLCLPTDAGNRALDLLLTEYVRANRRTCLFTELRNVSDLVAEQPLLKKHGFKYAAHLNYLIDLDLPVEEVFHNIGARTRKNLKRGLNHGDVVIREATEPAQLEACYALIRQTYQAARVPLADRSLFDSAFEILHPKKMIRFTLATVSDIPVAASVDLLYKDVIYGWYGGMDRAYSRHVPNELLMWHLLKWGAEHGYHVYDFGGAGSPDEEYGVRDFKAKFGGRLVCYGRNTCVHRPALLWLSTQGYQFTRRLFHGLFFR